MSIKLNAEKMHFRQKQGTYMGHMISSEGRGADPNKLKSINEMPPPTDKHGVQRILGIVNYVQLIFEPGDDEYVAEIDVKEQVNALASSSHPKQSVCHPTCQWGGREIPA